MSRNRGNPTRQALVPLERRDAGRSRPILELDDGLPAQTPLQNRLRPLIQIGEPVARGSAIYAAGQPHLLHDALKDHDFFRFGRKRGFRAGYRRSGSGAASPEAPRAWPG